MIHPANGQSPGRPGLPEAPARIHIVGIAGTGLRGMAVILSQRGYRVSGSEACGSPVLDSLARRGISCSIGHRSQNIHPETRLMLISAAIRADNPEVEEARRLDIPIWKHAELLGCLMRERLGIAVAGTHGKTTTTAMISQALLDAGKDPSFLIGGDYPAVGGSARWGDGEHFVAEACEFDRSFLNLYPTFTVITNIEEDHIDYFRSFDEITEAFAEFAGHLPPEGFLVLNGDDPPARLLARRVRASAAFFSLDAGGGDWWAEDIQPRGGGISFRAVSAGGESVRLALRVPGIHNVRNSLAVIMLLRRLGIPLATAAASLEKFTGVKRRFEVLLREPVVVIDDYAHHPTEIEMVLRAARETFPDHRVRVVFQPHQYSRTFRFQGEFARALAAPDEAVIIDVFAARDSAEDMRRINSPALVEAVRRQGGRAYYACGFDSVIDYVRESFAPKEVILCLGAGDITYLAGRLSEVLEKPVEVVA